MKRRHISDIALAQRRWGAAFALLAIGLAIGLTGGCAVNTPVSITSTSGRLPAQAMVQIAPHDPDGSLRAAFGAAVADALAVHSITTAPAAPLIAEFSIAARGAEAGIADPARSTADGAAWESAPRDKRLLDECRAIRLRATLVMLDRESGGIAYRGVGEKDVCAYGEAELAELADALVTDALTAPALVADTPAAAAPGQSSPR